MLSDKTTAIRQPDLKCDNMDAEYLVRLASVPDIERQLIALLKIVWRVQGIRKKIVNLDG